MRGADSYSEDNELFYKVLDGNDSISDGTGWL